MTDHSAIIAKIKKCLALAKSSNEHEAASALAQAQKLMAENGISQAAMDAAEASASQAKSGAKATPAQWESNLAVLVGDAFGCEVIFSQKRDGGRWTFIGIDPAPQLSTYAFATLFRQSKLARSEFIKKNCKRLKPSSKTRRADLFSGAWVLSVSRQVYAFAQPVKPVVAIKAYTDHNFGNLEKLEARNRQGDRDLRGRDYDAIAAGHHAAVTVTLNHGVGQQGGQRLIGGR